MTKAKFLSKISEKISLSPLNSCDKIRKSHFLKLRKWLFLKAVFDDNLLAFSNKPSLSGA